jgi:hypothetical protein
MNERPQRLEDDQLFIEETIGLAQEMSDLDGRYEKLFNGEKVDRSAIGILVRDLHMLIEKSENTDPNSLPTDRAREYVAELPATCKLLIANLEERIQGT